MALRVWQRPIACHESVSPCPLLSRASLHACLAHPTPPTRLSNPLPYPGLHTTRLSNPPPDPPPHPPPHPRPPCHRGGSHCAHLQRGHFFSGGSLLNDVAAEFFSAILLSPPQGQEEEEQVKAERVRPQVQAERVVVQPVEQQQQQQGPEQPHVVAQ